MIKIEKMTPGTVVTVGGKAAILGQLYSISFFEKGVKVEGGAIMYSKFDRDILYIAAPGFEDKVDELKGALTPQPEVPVVTDNDSNKGDTDNTTQDSSPVDSTDTTGDVDNSTADTDETDEPVSEPEPEPEVAPNSHLPKNSAFRRSSKTT